MDPSPSPLRPSNTTSTPRVPVKRSLSLATPIPSPKKMKRENVKDLRLGLEAVGRVITENINDLREEIQCEEDVKIISTWEQFLELTVEQQLARTAEDAEKIIGAVPFTSGKKPVLHHRLKCSLAAYSYLWHALYAVYKPLPSEFAKKSVWPRQQLTHPIMCLRPPTHVGLPLCVLHEVFRKFRCHVTRPNATSTIDAELCASQLCERMGGDYPNENARSNAIDSALYPLFHGWFKEFYLQPSEVVESSGRVDRVLIAPSTGAGVLREDKNEPTSTGADVYMQAAYDYALYIRWISDVSAKENEEAAGYKNFLAAGAPMFLLCIAGPYLTVAGGFYDGHKIIVEPLTDPILLLKDITGRRQERLAVLLSALRSGVTQLVSSMFPPEDRAFPASTPRLYKECALSASQTAPLRFEGPLIEQDLPGAFGDNPLFSGTLEIKPHPVEVVIKMVKRRYGAEVHRFLAEAGLAPTLYGVSRLDGIPDAYVMEYLPSPEWVSLDTTFKTGEFSRNKAEIRRSLDGILGKLGEKGWVHGDLRSCNVMINTALLQAGQVQIKIIDFDWAGEAGEVTYPATRNPNLRWPGKAGGPIAQEHDSQVVSNWFPPL